MGLEADWIDGSGASINEEGPTWKKVSYRRPRSPRGTQGVVWGEVGAMCLYTKRI